MQPLSTFEKMWFFMSTSWYPAKDGKPNHYAKQLITLFIQSEWQHHAGNIQGPDVVTVPIRSYQFPLHCHTWPITSKQQTAGKKEIFGLAGLTWDSLHGLSVLRAKAMSVGQPVSRIHVMAHNFHQSWVVHILILFMNLNTRDAAWLSHTRWY